MLVCIIFIVFTDPIHAATIEVEGTAVITSAGTERARLKAINDAKMQASLQIAAQVQTSIRVGKSSSIDSSRIQAVGAIGKTSVLREWQDDEIFHVVIAVDTEQLPVQATTAVGYKKKLTVTPFHLQASRQAFDLNDIAVELPRELLRRFDHSHQFLAKSSQYYISQEAQGPSQDNHAVKRMANMHGSQFVISGEVLNTSVSEEDRLLGFLTKKKRLFEIEIYLHDGFSGALLARHRLGQAAEGDVMIGRDIPFSSQQFFKTAYGHVIDKVIDDAVELLSRDMEKFPFSTKIIRVMDDKIYINAGSTSFIAPGDTLTVYQSGRTLPINSSLRQYDDAGTEENLVGTIRVVQVQPLFAICIADPEIKDASIEVGDIVRFEFVGDTHHRQDTSQQQ